MYTVLPAVYSTLFKNLQATIDGLKEIGLVNILVQLQKSFCYRLTTKSCPKAKKAERYKPRSKHYVPLDRKDIKRSFKRGISVVKRLLTSRSIREIVRKPVSYKPAPTGLVKKAPLRNPEGTKLEQKAKGQKEQLVGESSGGLSSNKEARNTLEAPSVEPIAGGHYELSPMLGKMVDEELQVAMAKVWELKPTNPQDAAEKVVVDKFRNKAGQALRNVLGLNVTKRLLNVHNPLYVKMVFSGKPVRADLLAFLKKYNISAFKRVGERGGTFAAKMRTFHDFDLLCTDKQLKCGNIRITVTPCYQFMTCPPNLRTPYNMETTKNNDVANTKLPQPTTSQEISKPPENIAENNTTNQKSTPSQQNTPKVIPPKPNLTTNTVKAAPANIPENNTISQKSTISQQNTPKVTPTKPNPTTNAVKTAPAKIPENNTISQQNTPKVTPTKPYPTTNAVKEAPAKVQEKATEPPEITPVASLNKVDNKPTENAKVNDTQNAPSKVTAVKSSPQTAQNKSSITKGANQSTVTKPTPKANDNPPQKVTPSKVATAQNSETKAIPAKASQNVQNTQKTVAKVATPAKATTQTQSATKVLPVKSQNTPKVAPKTDIVTAKASTPKIVPKVTSKTTPAKIAGFKPAKAKVSPKKKPSDFDELDDHDILALISEGIVLDECSGSDVE